jgi:deferrochelatase/peroxidase EfeB
MRAERVVTRRSACCSRLGSVDFGDQEQTIGRDKGEGAPLAPSLEHDTVDLAATKDGELVTRGRTSGCRTGGEPRCPLLRRGFATDGIDPVTNQPRLRLFHRAPARPATGFIPVQRNLARRFNEYIRHDSTANSRLPTGRGSAGYVGETLFS